LFGPQALPEDVLVAESDAVIGHAKLTQPIALASHQHVLMLGCLAVDPHQQRAGAGRRHRSDRGTGSRRPQASLRVLGRNTAARRLYAACGFVTEAP
jgi:predicted N-acetyltransferase YhbS